jgi:hypothetical protein
VRGRNEQKACRALTRIVDFFIDKEVAWGWQGESSPAPARHLWVLKDKIY